MTDTAAFAPRGVQGAAPIHTHARFFVSIVPIMAAEQRAIGAAVPMEELA